MSTPTTPRNDNQITLVVTGGDYFVGNQIAHQMLLEHKGDFGRLSVTLAHPERGQRLEKAGAELKQINYEDDNSLKEAFGGEIDWVLLLPDPEEDTRLQNTKKLIDAMQVAGKVANVVMLSVHGADPKSGKDLPQLKEFKEIEDYLKEKGNNWVIVRVVWISDIFHLWSKSVTEKNEFPLTLEPNQNFAPLQIDDVVRAIHAIIRPDAQNHKGKVYTLTGPEKIDGPHVVESLNRAIGEGKVQYKTKSRQELTEYLKSVRDNADDNTKKLFPGQPTDKQIETALDELEWIKSGEGDIKTDHLKKLTGSEGQKVEQFFKKNSPEFGGPKRGQKA